MKKTNKKGFTLAELLIVIAIIAILIAIAIPTFSGALRNARLQTDHANIRSAYAMLMTADMLGGIDINGSLIKPTDTTTYYFQKDGTLSDTATDYYLLQVDAEDDRSECKASIGCLKAHATDNKHTKGAKIGITYTKPAAGSTTGTWTFVLG